MRWVVTGCRGQLCLALVAQLEAAGETILSASDLPEVDVSDPAAVDRLFAGLPSDPDVAVNAAAFTHVDRCETEPQAAMDGRRIAWPRGRVLGGSSSINGMVYARGHRADYDHWRSLGLDGWGFDEVLPYFRKAESSERGTSTHRGGAGPLRVSKPPGRNPLNRAFVDAAREAAHALVRRLGRRREPAEMMVVAFASTAQVISGFESNRAILRDAIESVEPTDEEADLEAALALAGAFASPDESADQPPPQIVLISDGGVGPPPGGAGQGFTLRAGGLRFVGIGPPPQAVDNVGIVAFSTRRDYQDPQRVLAFARLLNAASRPVDTSVTLRVDGEAVQVRQLGIPAATEAAAGEAPVTFDVQIAGAAVLPSGT